MSQPLAGVTAWWSNVNARQFELIVESAVQSGIDFEVFDSVAAVDREGGLGDRKGVALVRPGWIPKTAREVFDGSGYSRGLKDAYLATFRRYLAAHPADGITVEQLDKNWDFLSDPKNGGKKGAHRDTYNRLMGYLDKAFVGFRKDLVAVLEGIVAAMNDSKVTGEWKKGRLLLDHKGAGLKLEKAIGGKAYRTPEGYLAHKEGRLSPGKRAREDWKIAIARATRHSQATAAAEEAVETLKKRFPGGDVDALYHQVLGIREALTRLLMQFKDPDYQESLSHAYKTWSAAAANDLWKFAEVPSYAEGRIRGSIGMLLSREADVREFNDQLNEFTDLWENKSGRERKLLEDELTVLLQAGVTALTGYLNAFAAVYEAEVDSAEKFRDWLLKWTREQLLKGFRTEHPAVWGLVKATRISLMAVMLGARLALDVLSIGSMEIVATPLFMGANAAMDELEDWVQKYVTGKDVQAMEEGGPEQLKKFLGSGYVTAQERAVAGIAHGVNKLRGTADDEHAGVGVPKKINEKLELLDDLDSKRGLADAYLSSLEAVIDGTGKAADIGGLAVGGEAVEKIRAVVNPLSMAGDAGAVSGTAAGDGLRLLVEVVGDTVTLIVPPKLVDFVGPEGKKKLERVLHQAYDDLDEVRQEAFKGLVRRGTLMTLLVKTDGDDLFGVLTDANGTPFRSIDLDTLRVGFARQKVLEIVLDGQLRKSCETWQLDDQWQFDFDRQVYLLAEGCSAADVANYHPKRHHDQKAIVAVDRADVLSEFEEEKNGSFVVKSCDGVMLSRTGRHWGHGVYDVVIRADGSAYYRGPTRPRSSHHATERRKATADAEKKINRAFQKLSQDGKTKQKAATT